MSAIVVRDVTLRDGLQLTGTVLDVPTKLSIVRGLLAAGIPAIEVGSLARPDLVPPLGNTLDLVRELTPEELDRSWVWVATPRHAERAVEAGVRHMQYCLSVSESHNQANLGRSVERSMAGLPDAIRIARDAGADVQLCLATSFTCPFEGDIDPDAVLRLVEDSRADGVTDVVVCDTIGQAIPPQVAALVARVAESNALRGVVFHGHDTWGMGVANAIAAVGAGASTLDAALGGLGGCPFAPGASGNTSTEDLLFALRPDWLDHERFAEIVRLGQQVIGSVGTASRSRSEEAARLTPGGFPWALAAR